MKEKKLTTADYIEDLKDKARRYEIKALAANSPQQCKEYKHQALIQQLMAERLQTIYKTGINTAVRKF